MNDPMRDCEHGRMKGKCEVCDLQNELFEQCRINSMSAEREDALNAKISRLSQQLSEATTYAIELQKRLVQYKRGSKMVLNKTD